MHSIVVGALPRSARGERGAASRHDRLSFERTYFGVKTLSTAKMTPLLCMISAMVTFALLPFSSMTMRSLPLPKTVSVPPSTVFSSALPPPFLMSWSSIAESSLPRHDVRMQFR